MAKAPTIHISRLLQATRRNTPTNIPISTKPILVITQLTSRMTVPIERRVMLIEIQML